MFRRRENIPRYMEYEACHEKHSGCMPRADKRWQLCSGADPPARSSG